MLKIAIMPVKNEDWILEKSLAAISLLCDYIIVADANSEDGTRNICARFPKVVLVETSKEFSVDENRRQAALNKAREYGDDNVIFCLDADEIPTANILEDREFWNRIGALKPGQSLLMEWVTLWRSPEQYRVDESVWVHNFKPFVFRDDGKTNYAPGNVHESRVPVGFDVNAEQYEPVKIIHYNFALWERMLSKQAHCRIMEYKKLHRSPFKINFRYGVTKEEKGLKLSPLKPGWTEAYYGAGINLNDFKSRDLYWYDIEILQDFAKNNPATYRWLDIWDIDWEKKRLRALQQAYQSVPQQEVGDPRSYFIKMYHNLLKRVNIQSIIGAYLAVLAVVRRP